MSARRDHPGVAASGRAVAPIRQDGRRGQAVGRDGDSRAETATQDDAGVSPEIIEEVDYPAGYAAGLAPIQLCYAAALNGQPAPDPARPYTYCELGCGSGRTVIVLAAANSDSRFVGIDLSHQHIETGRELAKASGLENLELLAEDVTAVALDALPDFDFITMHGLFAWVSDDVRAGILRFVDAKLRPGGLVHLSYNALPGWGAVAPIRQYFLERAPFIPGSPVEQVQVILDELEALREADAPFFTANESAAYVLAAVRRQDPRYVVHEFFSPEWRPLGVREVVDQMAEIGLEYVGDSRTIENVAEHSVPPAFAERVFSVEDPIDRQVLKDFITNRFFRGDVYRRPVEGEPATASPHERVDRIRFGMERTPGEIGSETKVSGAAIRVEGSAVEILQQMLVHQNQPLSWILDHPAFAEIDRDELRGGIQALSIDRALVPCARPSIDFDVVESALEPVPALNRVLLREPNRDWTVLACPVTGAGLAFHAIEACLLIGLCSPDPVRVAIEEIERRGIVLASGEDAIPEAEQAATVRDMLERFASSKMPLLFALGVIAEQSRAEEGAPR